MNRTGSILVGLIAGLVTYAVMSILYAALLASINNASSVSSSGTGVGLAVVGLALLYILPIWIGYQFYKLMKKKSKKVENAVSSKPLIADELAKLAQLHKDGVLSAQEFEEQKNSILSHQ